MTFQRACALDALPPAHAVPVTLTNAAGTPVRIAVVRDDEGRWHAVGDQCTHGDISLSEGDVSGCTIECWGHSARFDLTTGAPSLPATQSIPVYPLQIDGDDVLVDVDHPLTKGH